VRSYDGFTPDLVVVGGGMGGISATLRAAHLGARVLLAEPAALGGT
jgi:pyruvate/2-oxoglutarate dehydrogenase complex dihydrolipoamide dehydrogenase (E3) component